jgi:SWI/SNF-related matrix-associated actin-dependent regulator of chromatin subfamily A member 5
MYPAVFTDRTVQPFVDAFDFTAGQYDRTFMTSCQKLLQLIMLRRTKEGVASELTVPPREEFTLYAPLSPLQRFWYQRLLTQLDSGTFSEVFGVQSNDEDEQIIQETVQRSLQEHKQGTSAFSKLMNLLMQVSAVISSANAVDQAHPAPKIGQSPVLDRRCSTGPLLPGRAPRVGFEQVSAA